MTENDIAKIDPAMAYCPANSDGIAWHLPFEKPMKLLGFYWFDKYHKYHRLPDELPAEVTQFPQGVKTMVPKENCGAFRLSPQTAGGQVRFRTDSSSFQLHGVHSALGRMDHMPDTGMSGFDLYLKCDGVWKFFGVTRMSHKQVEFSGELVKNIKREMRDVIIDFPLYNGVESLAIGLDEDAVIEEPTPFADERPIVWYGTSIQQGGCASRPGMCSSNIVSRWLDRQVINLGFSGNGKGEPEIAEMLAEVKEPCLYIIDYTWNVDAQCLLATLPNLLDIIRKKHPETPILLMGPTPGRMCHPEFGSDLAQSKNEAMREEACRRISAGDRHIAYFDALNNSLGEDFAEATVDGIHLTDLGFYRVSQALCKFLKDTDF